MTNKPFHMFKISQSLRFFEMTKERHGFIPKNVAKVFCHPKIWVLSFFDVGLVILHVEFVVLRLDRRIQ